MYDNYMISLNLTSFNGARIEVFEDSDGIEERGVFIPLQFNNMLETNGRVYTAMFVQPMSSTDEKGFTHYIMLWNVDALESQLKERGIPRYKFVGKMKEICYKKKIKYGLYR